MKQKLALMVLAAALIVAAAAAVRHFSEASAGAGEIGEGAAMSLQAKIDAIRMAQAEAAGERAPEQVEISEAEMESFVLFRLRERIPARLDAFSVAVSDGAIAADTRMTFAEAGAANPLVNMLIGGTHDLFVKGRLQGSGGAGKFDLEEVKVNGIPVPLILVEALFAQYVKPDYPEADLSEGFDLPWGVEDVRLLPGKAVVVY